MRAVPDPTLSVVQIVMNLCEALSALATEEEEDGKCLGLNQGFVRMCSAACKTVCMTSTMSSLEYYYYYTLLIKYILSHTI